ncbi:class A beta-lactamase-related serine hydrolase [Microbacterium bovistercoris]|uniref:Class A beta-lactamase-related serine hydrolase n=1 Tax=Microbacterium bovistercoris TaxID=2293570 RepID=A0A371NXI3_9MICO|nr:serine hydrolase domain-containing protein [Microbacterium bovistercoris]REJ07461.1 class A beta-lactamase-related serine hydrolase [Microbacterium bovistercoris]
MSAGIATEHLAAQACEAMAERLDAATLRRSPASIAAVTCRGEVVAVRTHGEPRRDGAPTTPGTVFRIASMSKSFLAATALSLRDEGLLDLYAPIENYVPEAAAARFDGRSARITIDMLLSNRSGLAEDNPWGDEHLGESRESIGALVGEGLTLSAAPATEYQYSNVGQSLVGRAIEAVTGRPVEDVIRERMLDPLGLADTRASAGLYPAGADLAHGFRTFDDGESFAPEPYVGTGALGCIGSLFSTVSDIAAWMEFLGSAFDADAGDGVLSAASRRELQTAHTLIAPALSQFTDRELDGAGYGYGLVVEHDRRFGRIVQHAGGLPGFSSHMRWHPATGIGVVVFGNSDQFGAGGIAGAVLHDVLGRIDAPAAVVRPWPQTVAAARRVDELLRAGRTDAWDEMGPLARNVLRDVPGAVRTRRLLAALDETGEPVADAPSFETRVISATDASALRWTVPCRTGVLVCDVRMMGLHTPVVQSIDVQVAGSTGRKPRDESPRVTDHHRVVLG